MRVVHQRRLIREALVRVLIDAGTQAAARVFDHPWNEREDLPALVVEDLGEAQQATTQGIGAARAVERVYMVEVGVEVEAIDDWAGARDDLLAEVEAAVAGASIPGVKAIVPAGYDAQGATTGARPVVTGKQRFEVTYITPMNNPGATL